MKEIESADVLQLSSSSRSEVVEDVNRNARKIKLSTTAGGGLLVLTALFVFVLPAAAVPMSIASVAAYGLGRWLDSYRRCAVVLYDFEDSFKERYRFLVERFEALFEATQSWHIPAKGEISNIASWKRNAGASHLVERKKISGELKLPKVVRCNIDTPMIPVGKQRLYLFPDFLLVEQGRSVAAIEYGDLSISVSPYRFIETEKLPTDAEVIEYTWKHPNKNGGPDRRFAHNYQLPVCLYEQVLFQSATGLNELISFSRHGLGDGFATAIAQLRVGHDKRQQARIRTPTAEARPQFGKRRS